MSIATMTSKGQVTIPKEVRKSLKLHTGDKIEFTVDEKKAIMTPVSKKVDELLGRLFRSDRKGVSIAAMDDTVRRRMKETRP